MVFAGSNGVLSAPAEPGATADNAMTVRPARPADGPAWDRFVREHPRASPYHFFGWKDAVERAYGHPASYLVAEGGGRIRGVLPLVLIRGPWIADCAVSLPFCDFAGPLGQDEATVTALLHKASSWSRSERADLEIRCDRAEPAVEREGLSAIAAVGSKVRMTLALPSSSEELFKSFTTKLRTRIRRPEKNGLQFSWAGASELPAFYGVFCRRMRDLGSPVHARALFDTLLPAYGDRARLGVVRLGDTTVAAGICLSTGSLTSVPWSASLSEHNKLGPNMLLYWCFLEYAADHGVSRFDFGRSTVGEGTYNFKSQWGTTAEPLAWYTSADQPEDGSARGPGAKRVLIESLWRKLPLRVANALGPRLRRYVSL